MSNQYILTLSCKDVKGIVAAVIGFLADNDGFIVESAQYGDPSTGRFFMRTEFESGDKAPDRTAIRGLFSPIAERFTMDWDIYNVDHKPRVLIMVSKDGHCFNHILHRYFTKSLPIEIPAVISNHPDLKEMADWHNIPFHHLPITAETKSEQEDKILSLVDELDIDVVVLARYMQILSENMCEKLKGRAINIHHSFLPSFKGANPYKQAFNRGVKIIGATAHYVTADLDEGPIIEQEVLRVDHTKKPNDLKLLGQDIESRVLSHALKYHIEHRVLLNGQKTVVFK